MRFAQIAALLLAGGCFESPDYEGRFCGAANACPAGFICGVDSRCHRTLPQEPDATVLPDADAPDAVNGDADPPDADPADADPPDAGPADTGLIDEEVMTTVMNSADDAMEGPPNGDTLVDYAWASMYSMNHWGGARFRVPNLDANDEILAATLQLYFDSGDEDSPNAQINVQTGAAQPFAIGPNDIINRPRSMNSVLWIASDLGEGWHAAPDVSTLVRDAISDPTWTPGTPITFIIHNLTGPPSYFEFRQYDYPPAGMYAARLTISLRRRP